MTSQDHEDTGTQKLSLMRPMSINIHENIGDWLVVKLQNDQQQQAFPGTQVVIQSKILDIPRLLGELPTLNLANTSTTKHAWYVIDVEYSIANITATCMMRVYLPERVFSKKSAERILVFALEQNKHLDLIRGNKLRLISFVQESYEEIVLRSPK